MRKEIKLFETFAGIGSQYQALKNISKKLNFKAVSLGAVEWYIDAIISYQIIHYGKMEIEKNLTKNQMNERLKNFILSADSKAPVKTNYFLKMNEEKLRKIFPYLNSFLNNVVPKINSHTHTHTLTSVISQS